MQENNSQDIEFESHSDKINTNRLNELCASLPALLKDKSKWQSLKICKFEPVIHRLFMQLEDGCTLILHKIFHCEESKPFMHSHSWPFAVRIIDGGYDMSVGFSYSRHCAPKPIYKTTVKSGDTYEMLSPNIWHTTDVHKNNKCSYSIMIIGPRWRDRLAQNNDQLSQEDFDHLYDYFLDWSYSEKNNYFCDPNP